MSQYLKKRGGAVLITLSNGPLNTLSHNVRVELMHNLERARVEKASAVVIMGEGQHFSAGPDFKEFARGLQASPSVREIVSYLDTYPTHVIAGMHGVSLSSAFETALACHWRIANESATFGLPDVTVGKIPGASCNIKYIHFLASYYQSYSQELEERNVSLDLWLLRKQLLLSARGISYPHQMRSV